ncbi:uncharacterized protein LOC142520064 [Primulina tabacum]|uniref:uncharacterized protein LOC142520064 n=1 Tax=Primulina tabacum TaxID=48773 RepID=UPI003F5AC8E6
MLNFILTLKIRKLDDTEFRNPSGKRRRGSWNECMRLRQGQVANVQDVRGFMPQEVSMIQLLILKDNTRDHKDGAWIHLLHNPKNQSLHYPEIVLQKRWTYQRLDLAPSQKCQNVTLLTRG